MLRPYNAITKNGSTIVTVSAHNFEDAERLVEATLTIPGRRDVLESWTGQGKLIELDYMDNTDPAAVDLVNQILAHLRPVV